MFVIKEMQMSEWPAFQDKFSDLHIAFGAPDDFALFHRNQDGFAISTIAASGIELARVNALSPDGWSAVERLEGNGWAVLVGNSDVHTRLGVQIGSR
ncbi:hypothetical protein U1701_13025 [Sphingomonas sp. PB2P19]|uniref:hypothetical protein n=1 Tax=Sphingomonas rhamnosi TaxID=3096156 RepID=UPI002FC8E741